MDISYFYLQSFLQKGNKHQKYLKKNESAVSFLDPFP